MEEEIWKDIEGYERKYQISNLGRVKSLERKVKCGNGFTIIKEKILKQGTNRKGYKTIRLQHNGKKEGFVIHRLVALNFIENPLNKPQVNHIDGNKANNEVFNLEWNTRSENIRHAFRTGLNKCGLELDEKEIIKMYTEDEIGYVNIAREIGVSSSTIKRVLVRNKINIRNTGESRVKFKITKEEFGKMLKNNTLKEVAKQLNLATRTISKYKKMYSIQEVE